MRPLATVVDNTRPSSLTPTSLLAFSLNSLALVLPEIAPVKVTDYTRAAKSNGPRLGPHVTVTNCSF